MVRKVEQGAKVDGAAVQTTAADQSTLKKLKQKVNKHAINKTEKKVAALSSSKGNYQTT